MSRSLSALSQALGGRGSPPKGPADLLALSSPFLILLALGSMLHRSPAARLQAVPALLIGCGLLFFSWWRRRRRRSLVLRLLRERPPAKS